MHGFLSYPEVSIHDYFTPMRYCLTAFVILILCVTACGPKPYYKTAEGRKKQKHYNALQYGGGNQTMMRQR